MCKIKLAVMLTMPLAFLCSIATAQEQQPGNPAKSTAPTQLEPQTQTPPARKTQPQRELSVAGVAPARKTAPVQSVVTDVLPAACPTPVYAVPPGDVFGTYVPYVPPAQPTGCTSPIAQPARSNLSPPNSSAVQKPLPASLVNPESPTPLKLAPPTSNDLALSSPTAPSTAGSAAEEGAYVRPVPLQRAPTIPQEIRPFRSLAIGFKADTLGLGVEFATPMAYKLNLRSSINFFAFNDPFNIDGVDYNARLHFKSSETTVDWFPHGEGGLHISPGILYVKNTLSAPASVGPGQPFTLGTQAFVNSVDDPVNGSSSVVYARKFAPMLLLGYGNIIPRTGRHLSFPFEVGAAYTGAPQISVALNGTACTTNGCVDFATNSDAQKFLKQEVNNLNEDLKKFPVFPILSLGVAYHF
jgi:hypothetical protein